MTENFDPYRKWLGIPPEEQPPNHYRLLGIALFEDDGDVITYAADRQMSHVRKFQAGRNGEQSQHILNELAKARLCLLDRAQKIGYDQELQKTLGNSPTTAPTVPVAARKAPIPAPSQPAARKQSSPPESVATLEPTSVAPLAIPVVPSPTPAVAANNTRPLRTAAVRTRKKTSPLPLVLAICGLGAVLALAAIGAIVSSSGEEDVETEVATQPQFPTPAPSATSREKDRDRPHRDRLPSIRKTTPREPSELLIPDNPANAVDTSSPALPKVNRPSPDDPDLDVPSNDKTAIEGLPTTSDDEETADSGDDPQLATDDSLPSIGKDDPVVEDADDDDEGKIDDASPKTTPEVINDPQRAEKFQAAISAAREAFATRDLKEAARQVAIARQLHHGDGEAKRVALLAELQLHYGAFWRLVSTGLRKLQPGDELVFAGETATFDASSDGAVALFVSGDRLSRPIEDVEPQYLAAIAEHGSPRTDGKSRLALATFLALDRSASESDRSAEARRLLAEAVSLGSRSPALEMLLGADQSP